MKADFLHICNSLKDVKKDGVSVVCGQQSPEWQGWTKGPSGIQGDDLPMPAVKYTTRGTSVRVVTVLYPGENCPIAAVEADRDVDAAEFTLVYCDGSRVVRTEEDYKPVKE